ncbi:MAG: dTDP-N-acetylfucosamine:lipid II N-acetylfucosaminyltransferase [Sphingobacteriales bacterium]|jgi:dTDP-N-acetylfucosamine:lipid II N-acetylfucosaminyltransferase
MKHIFHISPDEKFINNTYYQFEKLYPGRNTFFILVTNSTQSLKRVTPEKEIFVYKQSGKKMEMLAEKIPEGSIVICHGLGFFRSRLINLLPPKSIPIWIVWGTEYYHNQKIIKWNQILGEKTFNHFVGKNSLERIGFTLKKRVGKLIDFLKFGEVNTEAEILKAMRRVKHIGILYPEEFEFIKKRINIKAQYLPFSYYPIEQMVSDKEAFVTDSNILLGNSAYFTNNHLEAFEILKKLPLNNKNIITPLSYGKGDYQRKILSIGKKELPYNFAPLVKFMPIQEYNNYILQCGIVVMNQYRQQAVGNIMTMLWHGAKVYLDERNSLYSYLKRIGIVVFSVKKDLLPENPNALTLLPVEIQSANREILRTQIGEKHLLNQLQAGFDPLLDESK